MSQIKREVLKIFKKLHRTRQFVFAEDKYALDAARKEINDRFKKNMSETNEDHIKKEVQLAVDVERELRTNVIQAKKKTEGVYELRISPDTLRLENTPFNPDAVITPFRRENKATRLSAGGGACDKVTAEK